MIKQLIVILIVVVTFIIAQDSCTPQNQSGSNNASPSRQNTQASNTCLQNQSGNNNAIPLRQVAPCNGHGTCDANLICTCYAGYTGVDCENSCTTAPTVAPTTVAPTTPAPTSESCPSTSSTPSQTCITGARRFRPRQESVHCNNHGTCGGEFDFFCICDAGYTGTDCETACAATPVPTIVSTPAPAPTASTPAPTSAPTVASTPASTTTPATSTATPINLSGLNNARSSASRTMTSLGLIVTIAIVLIL